MKHKSKKEESILFGFVKKFENDLAYARNWMLSFERDMSNMDQADECISSSISYAQNMKTFIIQVENSINSIKNDTVRV